MVLEKVKRVGIAAAHKAADVLCSHYGRLEHIDKKGAIDLVTEADLASEKVIIETIRSAFPDHGILAEESGLNTGRTDRYWVIDPLDGTTNYAHQLDLFSIAIAFVSDGDIVCGIVLGPKTEELFVACKGQGAQLNGAPIRVSTVATVEESLLVTGFPYDIRDNLQDTMRRFSNCVGAAQGVRRLGSAALDFCYMACGRFEAFWERGLKPWDMAAGSVIAEEAGAVGTDFTGQPWDLSNPEILMTNGKIHQEMIELLDIKETP
jgi:myo-inositol-1(or 4)-monophosphatase